MKKVILVLMLACVFCLTACEKSDQKKTDEDQVGSMGKAPKLTNY